MTADTIIYLYYGNAAASNQPNPTAVWNSSYSLVEHFSQASGTIDDSTSNGNNATPAASGATYDPNGRIGGDYSFDGTSTGLATIANAPSWNGAFAQYPVEFWVSVRQAVGGTNVVTDGGNFYIQNGGPGMRAPGWRRSRRMKIRRVNSSPTGWGIWRSRMGSSITWLWFTTTSPGHARCTRTRF